MKRFGTLILLISLLSVRAADAQLRVVTSLPDLASITELVGGDHVDVFSIATGYQNPHFVDPKPSYITRLARADVFVTVGLDLEIGWVPPLLQSSRNSDIMKGGPGYVDASRGIPLLQVPETVSRAEGDIHIYGNPHYWLDPERGKIIADNIAETLIRLEPSARADIEANLQQFKDEIDRRLQGWLEAMAPYEGTRIIAYHNEWPYLEERFGLEIVDFLEPKPGIPPTPSQLAKIIRLMGQDDLDIIITSPYFKTDNADLVARKTGARVVVLATSVGAFEGIDDYFDLFDYNIRTLTDALSAE
jgi:zinc/manganese transport system substrate-binding protein